MTHQWDDNLTMGIEELDNQHRYLFHMSKGLDKELDRDGLLSLINFISSYLKKHTELEESYMEKFNYPHYEEHKESHKLLVKNHQEFLLEMAETSAEQIAPKARIIMREWAAEHCNKDDIKFAAFVREHLAKMKEHENKESLSPWDKF